jgi:hypothetical protein
MLYLCGYQYVHSKMMIINVFVKTKNSLLYEK